MDHTYLRIVNIELFVHFMNFYLPNTASRITPLLHWTNNSSTTSFTYKICGHEFHLLILCIHKNEINDKCAFKTSQIYLIK